MALRAVVTGANRGIGLEVARGLVQAGAAVTAVVRTPATGEAATAALGPSVSIVVGALDELGHVRRVADELCGGPPIDLLVHNAGLWPARRVLTTDGFEQAFAVNHLAPFLLNHRLASHLAAGGRVVQVSAGLAVKGRVDLERTPRGDDFSAFRSYATTKLCNLALTRRWAEALSARSVTYDALHPGVLRTGLGDRSGPIGWLLGVAKRSWKPPEVGAGNVLALCMGTDTAGLTSEWFNERRREALPSQAADPALGAALWRQAMRFCDIAPG